MVDPTMSPRKFRPMVLAAMTLVLPLGACDGGDGGDGSLDSEPAFETRAVPLISQPNAGGSQQATAPPSNSNFHFTQVRYQPLVNQLGTFWLIFNSV